MLTIGLRIVQELGMQCLKVCSDLLLAVSQIWGEYKTCKPNIVRYLQKVKDMALTFANFDIQKVPRSENTWADLLSKLATLGSTDLQKSSIFKILKKPSIEELALIMEVELEPSWMDPLIRYLRDGILLTNLKEARELRHWALTTSCTMTIYIKDHSL